MSSRKEWSYKEAVAASSVANVAIAALLKGDLLTAGRSIESDHFHERYRQSLVKEFPQVKEVAHAHGLTPPICREQAQRS